MTTIAWDGKMLAADKRCCDSSNFFRTTKIFRTDDGRLIGASGDTAVCQIALKWLGLPEQYRGERPEILSDSQDWVAAIEVMPTGQITYHFKHGAVSVEERIFALGSGRDYALAAMACGKSAKGAVEIAMIFDAGTGSGIDTLTLQA